MTLEPARIPENRALAAAPAGSELNSVLATLRRCPLGHGLGSQELCELASLVRHVSFGSGQVIIRQAEPGTSLFIIVRGRVKVSIVHEGGDYQLLEYLGRGDHFGDMAVLTNGRNMATATAVMDSELLELSAREFQRLLGEMPGFAANVCRTLGLRLDWVAHGRRRRTEPVVLGLVNSTIRTQALAAPLARAFAEMGDALFVLTDRPEAWPAEGRYLIERLPQAPRDGDRVSVVRSRLAQVIEHQDRVLIDLTQRRLEDELPALLTQCERAYWLTEPGFLETSSRNLRKLLATDAGLAERMHWVWILHEGEGLAPYADEARLLAAPDFKIVLSDDPRRDNPVQRRSIERLLHHVRGTRVGLALSGGGARGMAHLGVLRALNRAGITIDLVAGTSIGALMGASYCAGWDPDDALNEYVRQLTPPRLLRRVPGGHRWFMYGMFRLSAWERMLRPYVTDARLEQMLVPFYVVAADLIGGSTVVRETGDIVHAILESINLPGIALPLLRDGMALVDGGILNNLPGDILPPRGAEVVLGVDVMAKLSRRFAEQHEGSARPRRRKRPGTIETLLRVSEVQESAVTSLRSHWVDLMIAPDTARFDFADFSMGRELADIGEAATEEMLPQIRQLLRESGAQRG